MTIKEKVFKTLREICCEHENEDFRGVIANQIAEILNIQRNVASHYLNELCKENKVIKTNTRPVYFIDAQWNVKKENIIKEKDKGKDPFYYIIGSNGSLREQVEQCKAAAVYPNKGLPIMLTGNSGVGKSYIAKVIYEYAIYKKCIEKDAPFITFNCADYANNPELLSANLFGYKKGAFTGANKDSIGLIEAANNGYLFLDEVHRLSPEGQEKLFLFLDQCKYKRIGEADSWRESNVRFIFATTENLDEVLLDTFKRRIPIFVEIPDLCDRELSERLAMIYSFYHKEAKEIGKDIIINKNVINSLLSIRGNGNVGLLKNIIISSLANAYRLNNNDTIEVGIENLPKNIKNSINIENNFYYQNMQILKDEETDCNLLFIDSKSNEIVSEELKQLIKIILNLNDDIIDYEKFKKTSNRSVNKIIKEIIFNNINIEKDILIYDLIFNTVNNALIFIKNNYGIRYHGNTTKIITYIIISLKMIKENISKKELSACLNILKNKLSDSYLVSEKLIEIIENTLDSHVNSSIIILITLYINSISSNSVKKPKGIIVAHGFSTASSIASVANTFFEEFIFEAFDMPIDVSTETVTKNIKEYLKCTNTEQGIVILVDMGSLNDIYNEIKDSISGDVGIINNISTRLALDVANNIINNESIENIVKKCSNNNKTEFKYYEAKTKKRAILVTCISGVGTAEKIKNILAKCIGESELEIIAQDYDSLVNEESKNNLLKKYDVKLVISTSELYIPNINVIELQNLMSGEFDEILSSVIKEVNIKRDINEIKDNIIKLFSLENIMNQLTILNPNKIIEDVTKIVNRYQISMNKDFKSELKLVLIIHISALIERLVMRDAITSHSKEEEFIKNNSDFIKESERIFEDVLKEYRVTLPIAEIINIYYIIELRN